MARKNPDRPLYVNVPRDLDKQPAYRALSRDAQWLLQHLERDPYRLGCGVFILNHTMVAKAARAAVSDVSAWFDELTTEGWAQIDDETGEVWLTQHMEWDFTLASPNQAKGVLRDLKRVNSERLATAIERRVYARWPALDPGQIDPGWTDPEGPTEAPYEGASSDVGEGPTEAKTPSTSTTPKHEAQSPKHEASITEPEAHSPSTEHEAQRGAPCELCGGLGVRHDERGESVICNHRRLKVVGE